MKQAIVLFEPVTTFMDENPEPVQVVLRQAGMCRTGELDDANKQESNYLIECVSHLEWAIYATVFLIPSCTFRHYSRLMAELQRSNGPFFVVYCTVGNIDRGETRDESCYDI
jgi:hypothetical protein